MKFELQMSNVDSKRIKVYTSILFFMIIFISSISISRVTAQNNKSIIYYGDSNCHLCHESQAIVQEFSQQHPDVEITYYMMDLNNQSNLEFLESAYSEHNISSMSVPVAVLNNSTIERVLFYEDITLENLNYWYLHGILTSDSKTTMDISSWVAFVSGLVIGASPCVLLILSIFGTSISLETQSKKFVAIAVGFIIGILLAYIFVSVIFIWLLPLIDLINNLRIIFGLILLIIGLWQIIDYKKENSRIFGTPTKFKSILKSLFSQNSGIAALWLGFLFAMIKIPCFGGIYLTILYAARDSPLLIMNILLYLLGMILPIIGVFIALRFGLMAKSINNFRENNRHYLRLLSGILLISLTGYLLLGNLEDYFLLLMIILIEFLIFGMFIYLKQKMSNPKPI